MSPLTALGAAWVLWLFIWAAAALWASPAAARLKRTREARYAAILFVGLLSYALAPPQQSQALFLPILWRTSDALGWPMVALAVLGLVFSCWARIELGRLWSVSVTRKAEHRIVDTGPYRIVRHPIYTGVLCALLASTVVLGTMMAVTGFLAFVAGFLMKARLEESFLRTEIGDAAYDAYARRVPMLVPFLSRKP